MNQEKNDFFQETQKFVDEMFEEAYLEYMTPGEYIKLSSVIESIADNLDDIKKTVLFLLWYKVFLEKEQEQKISLLQIFKKYDSSQGTGNHYSTVNDKEYRAAKYNYDTYLTQKSEKIANDVFPFSYDVDENKFHIKKVIKTTGFYHEKNKETNEFIKLLTPSSVFSTIVSITGKYKKLKALNDRIARGDLRDSSYFGTEDFKEALNQLEDFYDEIEWADISYFEKCFHYYQLEIAFRYETYYKLAVAMQELTLADPHIYTLSDKELLPFSAFYAVSDGRTFAYQNHQIIGMEKYIHKYKENPHSFTENIAEDLMCIYSIIYTTVNAALDNFKDRSQFIYQANESLEVFCENLWGERQHIIFAKADAIENNELKSFYYRRLLNRS